MDLTKDWYRSEFINHELLEEHRTLEKELSFYDAIVNGDIDFVTQNCDEKAFVNPEGMGKLSEDPLQNILPFRSNNSYDYPLLRTRRNGTGKSI